jgi:hypothetical protein
VCAPETGRERERERRMRGVVESERFKRVSSKEFRRSQGREREVEGGASPWLSPRSSDVSHLPFASLSPIMYRHG